MNKKEKPLCLELVSLQAEMCFCLDANYGESNLGEDGKVGAMFWRWNNCFINVLTAPKEEHFCDSLYPLQYD